MSRILAILVSMTALIALPGCADVPAWERGNLAQPHMAADPLPGQRSLQEHIYSSRESGAAGAAGQGGGCGCY